MQETEIFDRVAAILQANFARYQDINVFLELGPADEQDRNVCAITGVRYFMRNDPIDYEDEFEYVTAGEFERAYICFRRIDSEFYELNLFGHFLSKFADAYRVEIKYVKSIRRERDRILDKKLPLDLVIEGFADMRKELVKNIS